MLLEKNEIISCHPTFRITMFDDYSSEENSEESSISSDHCLNTDIDEDEFSKKLFLLLINLKS